MKKHVGVQKEAASDTDTELPVMVDSSQQTGSFSNTLFICCNCKQPKNCRLHSLYSIQIAFIKHISQYSTNKQMK